MFGGTIDDLPGGMEPHERFVRAAAFLKTLPEPKDHAEAAAYLYSVIRNVSQPFGTPARLGLGASPTNSTWWTSASDLKDRAFYFHWTCNPNVVRVSLDDVDFSPSGALRILDPGRTDLEGDVTNSFETLP
jgi:choloylglycine hydrolase